MGDYIAKIAHQYPKIGRSVSVFHPDLQGPMDICEGNREIIQNGAQRLFDIFNSFNRANCYGIFDIAS